MGDLCDNCSTTVIAPPAFASETASSRTLTGMDARDPEAGDQGLVGSAGTTVVDGRFHDEVVAALLAASRAMVAIAARSLADQDMDVTLPQFRALVVLASRGPQRVRDISAELGVDPSTGTRLCDRLARKGLVRRHRSSSDRRAVRVTLTPAGQALLAEVTSRRRAELSTIVSRTGMAWPPETLGALHAFATAAGEIPDDQWWLARTSRETTAHPQTTGDSDRLRHDRKVATPTAEPQGRS
jgi:DNA-binding MarR family transcriptional regulator